MKKLLPLPLSNEKDEVTEDDKSNKSDQKQIVSEEI
jgi:hypothetical protein